LDKYSLLITTNLKELGMAFYNKPQGTKKVNMDQFNYSGAIKEFMKCHFRHFNAAVVVDAAEAYIQHLSSGGKMVLTLAGAMSTAEIGLTLAKMIREEKVHCICSTGANIEEDIFNLVAHNHYMRLPNYRSLTDKEEVRLRQRGMNRVTDTCIPEEEAMNLIEGQVLKFWQKADIDKKRYFPYEYIYQLIRSGVIDKFYQIDPLNSWVVAACEKDIPIFTPGWEDSTLGNIFVANVIRKTVSNFQIVKSGVEQMAYLIDWYQQNTALNSLGFFQIGGGIAGDFPICVVPLINQDLKEKCRLWGYFCQISDSTTSYGSYSGAVPNEKISWGKLDEKTPRFVIESDASIVAPLIFAYVLDK
jgi:deoxyhypusine synthase